MSFVWISAQTGIISLYSINWLGFITDTEFVYCAVRAEYIKFIFVSVYKRLIHGRPSARDIHTAH